MLKVQLQLDEQKATTDEKSKIADEALLSLERVTQWLEHERRSIIQEGRGRMEQNQMQAMQDAKTQVIIRNL